MFITSLNYRWISCETKVRKWIKKKKQKKKAFHYCLFCIIHGWARNNNIFLSLRNSIQASDVFWVVRTEVDEMHPVTPLDLSFRVHNSFSKGNDLMLKMKNYIVPVFNETTA